MTNNQQELKACRDAFEASDGYGYKDYDRSGEGYTYTSVQIRWTAWKRAWDACAKLASNNREWNFNKGYKVGLEDAEEVCKAFSKKIGDYNPADDCAWKIKRMQDMKPKEAEDGR